MILVSDASVLIDVGYVGGLELLPAIAPVEVLDVVLLECENHQQPGLIEAVRDAGIIEVAVQPDWVRAAYPLKTADLSLQDVLGLYYAREGGRTLLATDRPLRERCMAEGVEVHGTLWIAREALAKTLLSPEDVCRWLRSWATVDSRLPEDEVIALAADLGCS